MASHLPLKKETIIPTAIAELSAAQTKNKTKHVTKTDVVLERTSPTVVSVRAVILMRLRKWWPKGTVP